MIIPIGYTDCDDCSITIYGRLKENNRESRVTRVTASSFLNLSEDLDSVYVNDAKPELQKGTRH